MNSNSLTKYVKCIRCENGRLFWQLLLLHIFQLLQNLKDIALFG